MTSQSTKVLAIAAAVLLAVAVLMNIDGGDDDTGGGLLLPDLKSSINHIDSVSIEKAGERATIVNDSASWVVRERDGYAADTGKLRQALLALAEASRLEAKTADPDRHVQLGLAGTGSADSTLLEISGDGISASLILGDTAQRDYRYARLAGDNQSWLIDENPDLPADPADWLVAELLDVPSSAVRQVTIEHADGEVIRLARNPQADDSFTVEPIPAGRELSYDGVAGGIAAALQGLALDDVRRAPDNAAAPDVTTRFTTDDGLVVTVMRHPGEDTGWYAFSAGVDTEISGDAAGDADTGDDMANEAEPRASAADRAAAIDGRVEGWHFRLPTRKGSLLARRWDDILKPLLGGNGADSPE